MICSIGALIVKNIGHCYVTVHNNYLSHQLCLPLQVMEGIGKLLPESLNSSTIYSGGGGNYIPPHSHGIFVSQSNNGRLCEVV